MIKDNIKYFSTGEFAKLCGVNKKTLFHYDDIDLLKPETVCSNGYRYYSEHQIEIFKVIITLKDIGMPLKEIKHYLDNRNPQNMIDLFEYETKEIQKEIDNLKRKQQLLSTKIKLIREGISKQSGIFIEETEEEYLVLSNKVDNSKPSYDLECYSNFISKCYKYNLNYGYPIGTIKTKEDLESKDSWNSSYFYMKIEKNCNYENIVVKPKGTYVVSYVDGDYYRAYIVYKELLDYIKENNLEVVGFSYEDVLLEEVVVKNSNDFVLKISIQVEKASR